jgi:cytoskeletal protein RodZ
MTTLGQRLKAEREKRGLTIEKLAAETRIHVRHFEAIEEDRTADLPSGFFYRSFVRQYARMLDLPEADYMPAIQRSLDDEARDLDGRETALPQRNIDVPPMPTGRFNAGLEARRWLLRLGALVVVIAASSGLYYLYQQWRNAPPAPVEQAEAVVKEPSASIGQPVSPSPRQSDQTSSTPPPVPPVSPAPAAAAVEPDQSAGAALRLTLVATADTWLQLTSDGRILYSDVLRTGQARTFRGNRFMSLRLGNAGGVSMEFNGAAVPPAGPIGQVRTVEFSPEGARVVTPPIVKPEITPLPVPRPDEQN